MGATAFAALLNRFYEAATRVLIRYDAVVDKMVGDEVFAWFVPAVSGPRYRGAAALAAVDLVRLWATASGGTHGCLWELGCTSARPM